MQATAALTLGDSHSVLSARIAVPARDRNSYLQPVDGYFSHRLLAHAE